MDFAAPGSGEGKNLGSILCSQIEVDTFAIYLVVALSTESVFAVALSARLPPIRILTLGLRRLFSGFSRYSSNWT